MKALLGFFKRFRVGLITHVVVLLWLFAGYLFGTIEREGYALMFKLAYTINGLLVFDFMSAFIAAGIIALAGENPAPKKSRDFFLGFAVSGGLLVILLMALGVVTRAIS